MNSIKIVIAILLDKIKALFSKEKENTTPVQHITETVVENSIHIPPATTPAPEPVEEAVTPVIMEEPKKAKPRKKKKG